MTRGLEGRIPRRIQRCESMFHLAGRRCEADLFAALRTAHPAASPCSPAERGRDAPGTGTAENGRLRWAAMAGAQRDRQRSFFQVLWKSRFPGQVHSAWGCCMRAGQETAADDAGVRFAHSQSTSPIFSSFHDLLRQTGLLFSSTRLGCVVLKGCVTLIFMQGSAPLHTNQFGQEMVIPSLPPIKMSIKF